MVNQVEKWTSNEINYLKLSIIIVTKGMHKPSS